MHVILQILSLISLIIGLHFISIPVFYLIEADSKSDALVSCMFIAGFVGVILASNRKLFKDGTIYAFKPYEDGYKDEYEKLLKRKDCTIESFEGWSIERYMQKKKAGRPTMILLKTGAVILFLPFLYFTTIFSTGMKGAFSASEYIQSIKLLVYTICTGFVTAWLFTKIFNMSMKTFFKSKWEAEATSQASTMFDD